MKPTSEFKALANFYSFLHSDESYGFAVFDEDLAKLDEKILSTMAKELLGDKSDEFRAEKKKLYKEILKTFQGIKAPLIKDVKENFNFDSFRWDERNFDYAKEIFRQCFFKLCESETPKYLPNGHFHNQEEDKPLHNLVFENYHMFNSIEQNFNDFFDAVLKIVEQNNKNFIDILNSNETLSQTIIENMQFDLMSAIDENIIICFEKLPIIINVDYYDMTEQEINQIVKNYIDKASEHICDASLCNFGVIFARYCQILTISDLYLDKVKKIIKLDNYVITLKALMKGIV